MLLPEATIGELGGRGLEERRPGSPLRLRDAHRRAPGRGLSGRLEPGLARLGRPGMGLGLPWLGLSLPWQGLRLPWLGLGLACSRTPDPGQRIAEDRSACRSARAAWGHPRGRGAVPGGGGRGRRHGTGAWAWHGAGVEMRHGAGIDRRGWGGHAVRGLRLAADRAPGRRRASNLAGAGTGCRRHRQGTWRYFVLGGLELAGDRDDGGAGPEPVTAQAQVELVRLMEANQGDQRIDVFDDPRSGQYRSVRDHLEFRAQLTVVLLDVDYARVLHRRQHAPLRADTCGRHRHSG
ncbi:hypothetical protein FrEUN1fDRAFT_6886 [Parafrankia sp. EUN1f]|nr:hypothetical protein FrEUN1fDRAFT_6886 [Parafrankia sp. EUN1f]